MIVLCTLCGCSQSDGGMDQALILREQLLKGNGCQFAATVTADYQDVYYTFKMRCEGDSAGNVKFEVIEPESIRGITGMVSSEGGKLTFDDQVLVFATLAEGEITPIAAPWVFLHTFQSGYIDGCAKDIDGFTLQINDSYADDAIQLSMRIEGNVPVKAEMFWKNRRVVTITVEDFSIL